jgi:phosphoglycolate phosphatase-like HAD superfamily hydrolase
MTTYDAVVYDLDGTLVRLVVDWVACERELAAILQSEGIETTDLDAWELLAAAEEAGIGARAEATIAEYERGGARDAIRLETADEVTTWDVPVGVCSLNCEAACRIALERVALLDEIDVVIGRDSHTERKPHPGPLEAAISALEGTPKRSLFVGDSDSDRVTAERAGVAFRSVPAGRTSR